MAKAAKAAAPKEPVKEAPKKARTKSDTLATLAEKTGLTKKQIGDVIDNLGALITGDLGKKGPGMFTLPGLAKFKLVRKPAQGPRQGINPKTKEPITIKAKPASNQVRIRALKALKESV